MNIEYRSRRQIQTKYRIFFRFLKKNLIATFTSYNTSFLCDLFLQIFMAQPVAATVTELVRLIAAKQHELGCSLSYQST